MKSGTIDLKIWNVLTRHSVMYIVVLVVYVRQSIEKLAHTTLEESAEDSVQSQCTSDVRYIL